MTVLKFDANKLTFGDLEAFEDIVGKPFSVAMKAVPVVDDETGEIQRNERGRPVKEVQPTAKSLVALVYIANRKANPRFTVDDARAIQVSEFALMDDDRSDADKAAEKKG